MLAVENKVELTAMLNSLSLSLPLEKQNLDLLPFQSIRVPERTLNISIPVIGSIQCIPDAKPEVVLLLFFFKVVF